MAKLNKSKERITFNKILGAIRYLPQTMVLIWEASPLGMILLCLVTIIKGVIPVGIAWITKVLIDTIISVTGPNISAVQAKKVLLILAIEFGLILMNHGMNVVGNLIERIQGFKLTDSIIKKIHKKSISLDLEYFENSVYFDKLHRAQMEMSSRPMEILKSIMNEVQNGILFMGYVGIIFVFDVKLIGVIIITTIPSLIFEMYFSELRYNWFKSKTGVERKCNYINYLLSFPEYSKEIKIYDIGQYFVNIYQKIKKQLRTERVIFEKKFSIALFGSSTLSTVGVYGCYIYTTLFAITGRITIGKLVMYYKALSSSQKVLKKILNGLTQLYESNLFVNNLYELLELEPKIKERIKPLKIARPWKSGIRLENVRYRFPGTNKEILKGINMSIRPGERIALVGENGAGKTTLVKLLCRLYDPIAGKVLIDGIDIKEFGIKDLHDQIGVIFQDFVCYEFTLGKNIGLGDIRYINDIDRIKKATENSGGADLIDKMEEGYETKLGYRFNENGGGLSIGQWQKVALARAFMRESQLIILDEPTASLDVNSEYDVFRKIKKNKSNKAFIFISHRFSTVKMADTIYVLKDGLIHEKGGHHELMNNNNLYASLYNKQASSYLN